MASIAGFGQITARFPKEPITRATLAVSTKPQSTAQIWPQTPETLHKFLSFRHKGGKEFVMDYRARFPGMAPLTETGDPADCSWLTKAFAAECAFGPTQTEFHEAESVPNIVRVAQGVAFAVVTGIVAYAILV